MGKRKRGTRERAPASGAARAPQRDPRALPDGAEVEVTIERLLPGGLGLAHAGQQTILVALSAPGDRLRARIRNTRGTVAFASIIEVVAPSPARIEPPCPYFGRCGGCDFQQLTYEAQLAAKVEIIRDCLRRIARIEPLPEIPITSSPTVWRYRSRAQWQHDPRRSYLGYFERGSHNVCDVAECPVVLPALQETLADLRAELRAGHLAHEESEFQAVAGDEGISLAPPVAQHGTAELTREIAGERYRFNAECFFQINHELLAPLVHEALKEARGDTALDLYCGVGLFTLPLARRFQRVVGIEGNPAATRYARRNLSDAGLANATIETASVGQWLTRHASEFAPPELILLDPPRSGAEPETIAAIITLRPRHISYVSCDPATLARDLRTLLAADYQLTSVAAFDLFPQTHHVETVAHLGLSP